MIPKVIDEMEANEALKADHSAGLTEFGLSGFALAVIVVFEYTRGYTGITPKRN